MSVTALRATRDVLIQAKGADVLDGPPLWRVAPGESVVIPGHGLAQVPADGGAPTLPASLAVVGSPEAVLGAAPSLAAHSEEAAPRPPVGGVRRPFAPFRGGVAFAAPRPT